MTFYPWWLSLLKFHLRIEDLIIYGKIISFRSQLQGALF